MKRMILVGVVSWMLAERAGAGTPLLPSINTNNMVNITNAPYNANGNGIVTNTAAIQSAINAAAAGTAGVGGGTVEVPGPGTYLTGPLTLTNKVNLQVDAGATLKFLFVTNYPNYNGAPAYPLAGTNLADIEISGSGTIDGNGAGWWATNPPTRPYMIYFSKCQRVLIQDVRLQNPPKMHIVFKNSAANVTIQGITIDTVSTSPNTDGIDLIGTNCLVQNCSISAGDDNIALGSSSGTATTSDVFITNCAFGSGHGLSIGSNTEGGVSNLTVMHCTFNGTQYGIRMKSDNASSGGSGQGGIAQNLSYFDLGMTNIVYGPIVIYSYYNDVGNPTNISPATAASQPIPSPVPSTTAVWRNILISNLTATVAPSKGVAGIIWARTEMPLTNIVLNHVNITAPRTFDLYNAYGVTFVDSQITSSSGSTFALYNAQVTVTNSNFPGAGPITFDGLTTTNVNALSLYNVQASLSNTNMLGNSPVLTAGGSVLTINNNLSLTSPTVLNLLLGANTNQIAVTGGLTLAGTLNIADGGGFGAGVYTLFTYGTTLNWGNPALGVTPAGFTYSLDTNTAKQVNLVVTPPAPAAPTNLAAVASSAAVQLAWSPSATATSYNVKRSTTSGGSHPTIATGVIITNYTDTLVTNGVTYYYVVSAVNAGGESADSGEVSAQPGPSLAPLSLVFQAGSNQLQISWPADHIGWRLEQQTNTLTMSLSTNWTMVSGSDATNQVVVPINPAAGWEFLRLVYP